MVPGRAGLPAQIDIDVETRRAAACPFCPGSPSTPETYDVSLVPSGYPTVHADASVSDLTAYGHHTVFLFTDEHRGRLVDQSTARVADLLAAIAAETTRFFDDDRIEAVFGFQVSGDHFGPTVDHPHGQLVGLGFTPRRLTLAAADPLCRICAMTTEEHSAPYVVCTSAAGRVMVPPFARLPFEMWVVPHRHVGRLADLDDQEIAALADLLRRALGSCLDDAGTMPQHLLNLMQAPRREADRHHLRIEVMPLHLPQGGLKRPGGLELGAGIYVNPLDASDAARLLRARVPDR
jgi:UDPglucose--hexose-1-phosphate uridylyltransferase